MTQQELVQKTKKKSKLTLKQILLQHLIQKQVLILRLEEILVLSTFIVGGVLGRALMQALPSIEPITFFAVLAGALFGKNKGAVAGATSWYLSNFFVFGGQGPWTIIQMLSGAFAGYLGGFLSTKAGYLKTILVMIAATVFFELVMNISSGFFFGFGIIVSFMSAIPFMIAHIVSNTSFACMIPRLKKTIQEKGHLNEKEVYKEMLERTKVWKKHDGEKSVE